MPVPENVDFDGDLEPLIHQRTSLYAATDEKHDAEAFAKIPADKRLAARGIEVGHIFYFGTKYSKPLNAKVAGPERRRRARRDGLLRRGRLAPGRRHHRGQPRRCRHHLARKRRAVPRRPDQPQARRPENAARFATIFTANSTNAGVEVLYDDTDERAGAKFSMFDLIGLPWQIIVGPRGLGERPGRDQEPQNGRASKTCRPRPH